MQSTPPSKQEKLLWPSVNARLTGMMRGPYLTCTVGTAASRLVATAVRTEESLRELRMLLSIKQMQLLHQFASLYAVVGDRAAASDCAK